MAANKKYRYKWWSKIIRFLSWFSFRYWWFVWAFFLVGILLWIKFCFLANTKSSNCDTITLTNKINEANGNLDSCCNCFERIDTVRVPEPIIDSLPKDTIAPPSPPETIPCDGNIPRGSKGSNRQHIATYEMGNIPGTFRICYATGETYADKIEVYYDGEILLNTGFVKTGHINSKICKSFRYNYKSGKPTYIEVRVNPSGSKDTEWEYSIGCPK